VTDDIKKEERHEHKQREHLKLSVVEYLHQRLEANPGASEVWKAKTRAFASSLQVEILETAADQLDAFDVPGRSWPQP
jgi:hypothetical protein